MDSLEMKCKCHGVSGSCSVKTCWKGLQDISTISADLKSKYLSATKVIPRQIGTRRQLVPREMEVRPVGENELVYLVSSPDYCAQNAKQGSLGTTDRWDTHCQSRLLITDELRGSYQCVMNEGLSLIPQTGQSTEEWKEPHE